MSYTIETYTTHPAVVQTFNLDYDLVSEIPHSNRDSRAAIDTAPYDKVYLIDVFNFHITIDDIIRGANIVARGANPLWHHPKLKQVILVTEDETLRIAAVGMSADVFGGLKVPVFATLDEALAYVSAEG